MDVLALLPKPSEYFFLDFAVFFKILLTIGVMGEDGFEGGRRETTTWVSCINKLNRVQFLNSGLGFDFLRCS